MDESMILRLYSLDGNFKVIQTIEVGTICEAREIVEKHIDGTGYKNLKTVDDTDYSMRYTATTPNGRAGRNVAALDF
jgi:hypothetical protein